MFASGPILWIIVIAGGAALLGAVMVFGIMRNRSATPAEDAASERRTRELYHKDDNLPR